MLWGHSKETLQGNIFSKNSLFIWILKTHRKNFTDFSKLCENPPPNLKIFRLQTKADVEKFFGSV